MAATLDQLSGGRLDVGLGAGWNEAEFLENGLPFPRPGERLAMLEEALGVLSALLTDADQPASFSGRFYRAEQAPVVPGLCSGPARRCGSAAAATGSSGWSRGPPTAGPVLGGDPEDYLERSGCWPPPAGVPAATPGRCGARSG